jgi:Calcineurin-like phosphoesterase
VAESDGIHHSEHWASRFVDHTGTLLEEELRKVAGHLEHPIPAQPLPHPPATDERRRGYRMSLADVFEPESEETAHSRLLLRESTALSFHLVGDTGGHALRFGDRFPPPQRVVAYHLAQDAHRAPRSAPVACLFHLGDLVYHYGETSGYPDQFHAPYGVYPEPIFAIPGNHDAMVEPGSEYPSLEAFTEHFCAPPGTTRCSCPLDHTEPMHWRRPMNQPNVYFTLETPVCWFIGLATNAPEGGTLTPDGDDKQKQWLTGELRRAPEEMPVLLCLHHPPYSCDVVHGGSSEMETMIDTCAAEAGRRPAAVLSGHAHSYQRFVRTMPDGSKLPYFVVGAGGHPLLEKVDPDKDPRLLAGSRHGRGWRGDGDLELAAFNDTHHGFLRLTVSATHLSASYLTVPSSLHPEWSIADAAREADRCVFRLPTASRSPATG